jgi:site-specific DNA-methyltransferase (adenine-specific)
MTTHDLHLGNCLDPVSGLVSLPSKSVDHVIMDPPYEKEAHSKVCRANTKGPGHGKSTVIECQMNFAPMTELERNEVSRQTVRISRGWILVFCQIEAVAIWRNSLIRAGAKWRRGCVWVKPDAMPQITGDRPGQWGECMALAWAGEGRSKWNNHGKSGAWIVPKYEKGRVHAAQKPMALMRQLIAAFTLPGQLICDPYAGAGTTLVAAKETGRNSIGWEMTLEYHTLAQARLDSTLAL